MSPLTGSSSGFERIQFESGGSINNSPAASSCQTYFEPEAVNEVYAVASSTGDRGLVIGAGVNGTPDGVHYADSFFNGFTSKPLLGPAVTYAGSFPEPSSAVVIPDTGDEAVATAQSPANSLLIISGVSTSNPKAAKLLTVPTFIAGLAISADGKSLIVRSGLVNGLSTTGLTVYSIAKTAPSTGPLGGTVAHSYTMTGAIMPTATGVISAGGSGGRDAMAPDPADPSRVVLAGTADGGFSMSVQVVTGLPNALVAGTPLTIEPGVSGLPVAATVSRDGKYAYVATKNGIDTVSGIGGGALKVVGTTYLPSTGRLKDVHSLATSVDGKYLLAVMGSGTTCTMPSGVQLCGELVVAPIGAGGVLGNPVLVDDATGEVESDTLLAF